MASGAASVPGPGARIAGYVVQRAIARGGMGQVFLATDERLQKRVALKVLARADADDEARARFLREARALARVEHPGVVRVLASGEDDGLAWMALDYIEGDSLTALAGGEPIDEETAVGLVAQVARGLAAVHAVGVVHRDIKPDNLLVDGDATVKIVDFGVAWLDGGTGGFTTRAGVVVGTPHFMSPEQARGGVVDARSDAWSLGATLWTLLAGRPPYYVANDEADVDILARLLRDAPPDIGVVAPQTSVATRALLATLLCKDTAGRPADMAVVATTLEEIAAALANGQAPPLSSSLLSVAASTSSAALPVREGVSWAGVGFVGLVFMLVVAGVAGGVLVGRRTVEPTVQERVVERVVKVEVPVPAPVVARAMPLGGATSSPMSPGSERPAPTAAELAHELAAAMPEEQAAVVDRVLARNDEVSRAALVLVAKSPGSVGNVVVERVMLDDRADRAAVLDAALQSSARGRALFVVEQLQRRRDDAAYARLSRIAAEHSDATIRTAASRARDSIFSASDESP